MQRIVRRIFSRDDDVRTAKKRRLIYDLKSGKILTAMEFASFEAIRGEAPHG
jgi:hypothetical protein